MLLKELSVYHYFIAKFFLWNHMSLKSLEETLAAISEYHINASYREIVLKPLKPFDPDLVGNYEYVATNKADFVISFEENGTILIEVIREIDENKPVEYLDEKRFLVEYIPLPFDNDIEDADGFKETVDHFFDTLERQNMTLVTI